MTKNQVKCPPRNELKYQNQREIEGRSKNASLEKSIENLKNKDLVQSRIPLKLLH